MEAESIPVPPQIYVDPFVIVASSASAVSARLCTHPRPFTLLSAQLSAHPPYAVDTLRIRVQTWPGAIVPPLKELIPHPRMRTLYAGELDLSREEPRELMGPRRTTSGDRVQCTSSIHLPLDVRDLKAVPGREMAAWGSQGYAVGAAARLYALGSRCRGCVRSNVECRRELMPAQWLLELCGLRSTSSRAGWCAPSPRSPRRSANAHTAKRKRGNDFGDDAVEEDLARRGPPRRLARILGIDARLRVRPSLPALPRH